MSKQQSPERPWDPDDGPRVIEACVRFVQRAVGLGGLVGAAPTPEYYRNLVRNEVGLIISELQSGAYGGQLAQFWDSHFHDLPTPMKSLRDVDETGEIFAARSTRRVPNISLDRVAAAMALVRNRRIGGRRSAAIGSELDDDAGAGDAG